MSQPFFVSATPSNAVMHKEKAYYNDKSSLKREWQRLHCVKLQAFTL